MILLLLAFRIFRKYWKYNVFIILELSLLISISLAFFNLPFQLIRIFLQIFSVFYQFNLETDLFFYITPLFLILLAILGCGIFFIRNLIHVKMVENIDEIRKLKQNGYALSQISRLFFIETLICAISAGIFAIIMGEYLIQITEYQLKSFIFPVVDFIPFHFYWLDAFSFKNILSVLGFSILFSAVVSRKVNTRILDLPIDQSRSPTQFNTEWSPGFQFLFHHIIEISLVTAFPILFICLMDLLNIDLLETLVDFAYFVGLAIALVLTPVFCVLFPFLITHFSIKHLFRVIEAKLKSFSTNQSPKKWYVFYTFQSLTRQKHLRYYRFIFLILTFNLLVFSVNYQQIEDDYYNRKELHLTGNGQFIRLDLSQVYNQSTVQKFTHYLNSFKSVLQFKDLFRYDYILNRSADDFPDELNVAHSGIVLDYNMYTSLPDDWLVDTTFQLVKERASLENFVICPAFYKTYGYHTGDVLKFIFSNASYNQYIENPEGSHDTIYLYLPIGGFYHAFPLIYDNLFLFTNYTLFSEVFIYSIDLVFTSVSMESFNFYSKLVDILDNQSILGIEYVEYKNDAIIAWNGYFGTPIFILERSFSQVIFYFILILLGLAFLNLGISIYMDNRTFLPESHFLYSQGASKAQIFRIYLFQFLFYGFIALIFAWCSLGPLYVLITLRNILASPYIPQFARLWHVDIGMSLLSLVLVFGIYTALFLLYFIATRKSFYRIEKSKNIDG